jgi:hypothetical protein
MVKDNDITITNLFLCQTYSLFQIINTTSKRDQKEDRILTHENTP